MQICGPFLWAVGGLPQIYSIGSTRNIVWIVLKLTYIFPLNVTNLHKKRSKLIRHFRKESHQGDLHVLTSNIQMLIKTTLNFTKLGNGPLQ